MLSLRRGISPLDDRFKTLVVHAVCLATPVTNNGPAFFDGVLGKPVGPVDFSLSRLHPR